MKQFEALFESVEFKKGTAIDFSATGRGKLVTKVNGKQVRTGTPRCAGCPPPPLTPLPGGPVGERTGGGVGEGTGARHARAGLALRQRCNPT